MNALEQMAAQAQAQQAAIGGIAQYANPAPAQPISSRVEQAIKECEELCARIHNLADNVAGPVPEPASLGESLANQVNIAPPLSRRVDALLSAITRINRNVDRLSGAL